MKILDFPSGLCLNLEGNGSVLTDNILSSDYGFEGNRYISNSEGVLEVNLTLDYKQLIKFENFFYICNNNGFKYFYAPEFKFSDNYSGDYIFAFTGEYEGQSVENDIYKIKTKVRIIQ